MGDKLLQALDLYEKAFDDFFPTVPMSGHTVHVETICCLSRIK